MFNAQFGFSFALLISFPLLFFFVPRFLPSKHIQIFLPDELDDLALFRRATLASLGGSDTVSDHQTARPKIAFLFLTNSNLHFAPLWQLFFQHNEPLYNIYVHADPSHPITPPEGAFSGRFIAAKKTQRGSPSLISAARRLLATALLEDPLNSYFALLSQHCIPLHSFQYMYNTLFLKPNTDPISSSPIHQSFIEILSGEPQMWDRYVARGRDVMLPEVPFDRFRIGSQFFVLTRQHALIIIRDRRLWRKFKLPCLNMDSCYPEEHYFPTLLFMEDPGGCAYHTLTRVNWTGSTGGHPHTYSSREVSVSLIEDLRVSNNSAYSYMFARKFSPECLPPLLNIAETTIFSTN